MTRNCILVMEWFTGSSRGSSLQRWGNLLCIFIIYSWLLCVAWINLLEGLRCVWVQFANEIREGIKFRATKEFLIVELLLLFSASISHLQHLKVIQQQSSQFVAIDFILEARSSFHCLCLQNVFWKMSY